MHCAAVLAEEHLLWSISGSYFVAIDRLQRGAAGLLTTAISTRSMSTPCPGMKLTLAWRLSAEISPNRSDKNLIPQAPVD